MRTLPPNLNPMKNLCLYCLLFLFAGILISCDALEKTDKVRSEVITGVKGKNLVYEMWLTGAEKFHYKFLLAGPQDTTQLFETRFQDAGGAEAIMDIRQTGTGLKIL